MRLFLADCTEGRTLSRLSFRQLLFAAFIGRPAFDGHVRASSAHPGTLRGWDETAAQAITLTEQSQRLSERTLAMDAARASSSCWTTPVFRERAAARAGRRPCRC
jgi:two-component system sensor histidine kinase GlrK